MLTVISPSKGQDFTQGFRDVKYTRPDLLSYSETLAAELRKLTIDDIKKLMGVSAGIAELNYSRFGNFNPEFTAENACPALFAFKGEVYKGFELDKYSNDDLSYAQKHLKILSGLYGCLRPLDLIMPYRLEMKTRLANPRGKNLYEFWGDKITECLNQGLERHNNKVLLNLASVEYFKAVQVNKINGELITVNFKEIRNGKAKIIGVYAKTARGKMANFIIRKRIQSASELKKYSQDNYRFNSRLSTESEFVFTR